MLRIVNIRIIDPDLFETSPTLRLFGGRERTTGRIVFPYAAEDERFERVPLPDRGTLWSYTVQRFMPKAPPYAGAEPFEPFAVGYVLLPGACIVAARLQCRSFSELRLELPMELTTLVLRRNDDVATVIYGFKPEGTPG